MSERKKFFEIQKIIEEPYIKLGFKDQWEMNEYMSAMNFLEMNKSFTETYKNTWMKLVNTEKNFRTIIDIAEIGLFCEEIGELLDSIRKDMPISATFKKKGETTIGEECADLFIRLSNFCLRKGIDLESEIFKKHEYNMKRKRLHGKKA